MRSRGLERLCGRFCLKGRWKQGLPGACVSIHESAEGREWPALLHHGELCLSFDNILSELSHGATGDSTKADTVQDDPQSLAEVARDFPC